MPKTIGQLLLERHQELQGKGVNPFTIGKRIVTLAKEHTDFTFYDLSVGEIRGNGKPLKTSISVSDATIKEIKHAEDNTYIDITPELEKLKIEMLKWYGVDESHWPDFSCALSSGSGTGGCSTSFQAVWKIRDIKSLAIEERGFPIHALQAKNLKLDVSWIPAFASSNDNSALPVWQLGPLNMTAQVRPLGVFEKRAKDAAENEIISVLDGAYPGYTLVDEGLDLGRIMKNECALYLQPFIDQKKPFILVLSTSKFAKTMALRGPGIVLLYCPNEKLKAEISLSIDELVKGSGALFHYPAQRGFVKAALENMDSIKKDHMECLKATLDAEQRWTEACKGTRLEKYFDPENYRGPFRLFQGKANAMQVLYDAGIISILPGSDLIRVNITGVSDKNISHVINVLMETVV